MRGCSIWMRSPCTPTGPSTCRSRFRAARASRDRLVDCACGLHQRDRGGVLQHPRATLIDESELLVDRPGELGTCDCDVGADPVRVDRLDVREGELFREVPVAEG